MLMNNLDPEVAERPADLVVYGGNGRAARSWPAFDAIVRTLRRLTQFDLACEDPMSDTVAVRRNVPPVNTRHLRRLPRELQRAHAEWAEQQLAEPPLADVRRRARRVAFTLLEQGDDPDHVERALHAIGFHPALCHESAQWAYQRHREALDHAQGVAS